MTFFCSKYNITYSYTDMGFSWPVVSIISHIPIQIWDFPGQIDFFDPAFDSEHIFGGCGALIFVIDAQVSFLFKHTNWANT